MTAANCAQISVLMPVYQPNQAWLRATIGSLNLQSYGDWQLVLSLDGDDAATVAAAHVVKETLAPGRPLSCGRAAPARRRPDGWVDGDAADVRHARRARTPGGVGP